MSFLSIDIGTSSCRAALVSATGRIQFLARQPVHLSRQDYPFAEVDCSRIWNVVQEVVRRLLAKVPGKTIHAIGVSSMLGYVFLGKENRPLAPAMLYADNRAVRQVEEILRAVPGAQIHRITGRRVTAELLAPKLLWLKAHAPDLAGRIQTVIGLKDEMVRRLTGIVSTDVTHANYTMLFNVFTGRLDRGLIRQFGLDETRLIPEPLYSDQVVGGLCGNAAAALGILEGTPVVSGSSDGTTAMYGGGVCQEKKAVLVSGTTDVLMMLSPACPVDPGMVLTINSGLGKPAFLVGGATGYSGATLKRFEYLFNCSFDALEAAVAKVPPGSDGLFVLPGLAGERAPYWRSSVTGAIDGLTMMHEHAHVFRALVEGVSYRIRRLLQTLSQVGLETKEVKVVGGLAGIDAINQIRADVTGIRMVRLKQLESTCLGTAMFCMSALAGGGKVSEISRSWVRQAKAFDPDPEKTREYARLSELFEKYMQ